jgi:LPXTG-motif cell wall-anchored protein
VAYSVNGTSQPGTDATIVLTPEKNGIGVDNDYLLGSLIVTQSTDGGSPPPPDAQFGGTIACTFQSRAVTLGGGHDFVLGVGASQTLTGLPIGADCTVDETDTDGAVAIGYAPSQTVPITADPPTVTVTATFQTGFLLLTVRSIGTAAAWANTPAEVRVTCVQDDTVVFDETVTVQGASGGWGAVAAPGGSQCSAQDTGVTGATSTSYSSSVDPTPQPQPVTVTVGQGGTATLHVDNAFIAAPLEVASVTGGAGAIFAKPATTRVDQCTFAGAGIDIVPGSASQSFTFPRQGGSASIALPAGASCRVTLTDAGATSSQVASTVNAAPVTSLGDTSLRATVNLTTGDQDPSSAVTFTNTLDVGRLPISVDVTGAAAWAASVPITVDVTCSLGGDPLTPLGPDGTVAVHFTADGTLVPDDGSAALAALPLGSSCSAVQQGDNGATAVDYEPAGSGSGGSADVPIELGGAAIVVTDRFDAADLVVSTTVAGNDGANHLDGDFAFDSACSFNGRILPPPPDDPTRPSAFSITGEGTHTIAGLPVGTSCTVTEYGTQNATQIAPSREQTAAIEAAGSAIGFENAFDSAPLGVSASIVGPAASQYAPQTVGATVSCQWPDGSGTADLPDGGQLVLDAGNDFEASLDAPYGTSCSVASPAGMATAVHVTPPVTMGLGDQHLLAITSEWDLASATVAKHTSGVFAGNPSFSFDARCTWADGSIPVPLAQGSSASFGLRSGGSATMTVLAGSTCAITETDAGGAARTDIVVADAITSAVNGRTAQVRLDAGTQPRIDVTNVAEAAADPLASTGSDAQAWLWLAVLLLAAGGVVLLARRRA